MKILCLLLLASLCVTAQAALYKWKDEHGRTHYSDTPPEEPTENLKVFSTPEIDNSISSPDQKVYPKRPKVVMYSTSWCGYCKKAKRYFQNQGIKFIEKDIETSAQARREYDQLGGRGVPLITVNQEKIQGYSQAKFDRLYQSQSAQ